MGVFSPSGPAPIADVTSTGNKNACQIQIYTIATKNIENTVTFTTSADLKQFMIRPRNNAQLRIACESGETADAGEYHTLFPGCVYWEKDLNKISSFTLYVRSNKDSTVLEIVTWT